MFYILGGEGRSEKPDVFWALLWPCWLSDAFILSLLPLRYHQPTTLTFLIGSGN